MTPPGRIDAHLHIWERGLADYAWIPRGGPLDADFTPDLAQDELTRAGVAGAFLVQADDSAAETDYLRSVAASRPWVRGVIGWMPLDDPHRAARLIDEWGTDPVVCGVRQLIHDDPRDDLLDLPEVRDTLAVVAESGLTFDVPDAWPRHLPAVARIADAVSALTVVVDHLGKPPADPAAFAAWSQLIDEIARRGNTAAKVSGLQDAPRDVRRRAWDVTLAAFGPSRLAWGSDWPMTIPHGGYRGWMAELAPLIDDLAPDERADVLGGTALRLYRRDI